jgi:NAD(P)-dependent dehydrogenase (short-subunit alcohol dehydrogenase family)
MTAPIVSTRSGIITGGGSGIGRAAALAFAKTGARVLIADISPPHGEESAHLIEKAGGKAVFVKTDVAVASQVEHMVDAAVREFGYLDYAFNNAGIATQTFLPVDEADETEWDRIIAINLKGTWLCMKYECKYMRARKTGAIVNTSSVMGKVAQAGIGAYAAAKAGVIGLTQSVALDYAQHGIRVNAVCPGGIRTPMTDALQQRITAFTQLVPMGRLGEAEEIANAVVWLCSEQASYITGQALMIDGAYTAK